MSDENKKIDDKQLEKKEPESIAIKKSTYNKLIVVIMAAVVVSVFLGGYILGSGTVGPSDFVKDSKDASKTTNQPQLSSQQKFAGSVNFDIPEFAKFRGSDSASVYLIEFGDYQCPFCKRFFDDTEPQMMTEYVDTGKTKFYFLDISIVGPDSLILGQGSWCADDQGKYWEYHDYMYANQGEENTGWATPEKLKFLVKNIPGLISAEFDTCLDSKKYEQRSTQLSDFSSRVGLTGTPTMFIGDPERGYTKISGAQPYAVFKQVIDAHLE